MEYILDKIRKKYPAYFGVCHYEGDDCDEYPPEMAVSWGDIIIAIEVFDIDVIGKMKDAIESFYIDNFDIDRFCRISLHNNTALLTYLRLVNDSHSYEWDENEIIDIETIAEALPGFGWEDPDKWEVAKRVIDALVEIANEMYSR